MGAAIRLRMIFVGSFDAGWSAEDRRWVSEVQAGYGAGVHRSDSLSTLPRESLRCDSRACGVRPRLAQFVSTIRRVSRRPFTSRLAR